MGSCRSSQPPRGLIHTHPPADTRSSHFLFHYSPATDTMSDETITPDNLHIIDTLFKDEIESDQDEYKPSTKKAKRSSSRELDCWRVES